MKYQQRGFTLVEMMVTLTLMAILATAALPVLEKQAQRQTEAPRELALRQLREAIDSWHTASDEGHISVSPDGSYYPPDLRALAKGVQDIKSPNEKKIYFLRSIPRDPFCDCDDKPAEQTWRIRSYTNPPGDYSPGSDVYDISSSSRATGLNGVPYAQW